MQNEGSWRRVTAALPLNVHCRHWGGQWLQHSDFTALAGVRPGVQGLPERALRREGGRAAAEGLWALGAGGTVLSSADLITPDSR